MSFEGLKLGSGGVTMDSDMPRMLAIVERLIQKKSLAAIPMVWFLSAQSFLLAAIGDPR